MYTQPWHQDYSRLDGNFCARDMDPLIKQWEAGLPALPKHGCKETPAVFLVRVRFYVPPEITDTCG